MKKTISLLLALIMLVGCASIYSAGAAETPAQITLNGTAYSFVTGTDITYTCNLLSASTVENGQFTLNYPESLLSIKDVSFPNINNVVRNWTENLENMLKLNFTNYNGFDFTTSKVLFQVKFTVVGSGSGEISLDKEVLSNVNDVNILNNATFTEALEGTKYVEPTTPTTPTTPNKSTNTTVKKTGKKSNPMTVKASNKTVKAKKLKKSKQTFKAITVKKAKGKVSYAKVKSGTTKKIFKKVTVAKSGKITLKKGSYKKGTYKIKIKVKAAGNSSYKSKTKNVTVKVKVK